MDFDLGHVRVHLESEQQQVRDTYASLLKGWQPPEVRHSTHHLRFRIRLGTELPPLPRSEPIYVQGPTLRPGGAGGLTAFATPRGVTLRFRHCAQVDVPLNLTRPDRHIDIDGLVLPTVWEYACFGDVLYAGLAPLLRRLDVFLLHAFAVCREGQSILLAGPSGSGKTTSGLSLMAGGWSFLANDVVALAVSGSEIRALPTPDTISVTDETLRVLPWLQRRTEGRAIAGKTRIRLERMEGGRSEAAPVRKIYFPEVTDLATTETEPVEQALAVALMAEGSVDRWDKACLPAHMDFLQRLSHQARLYRLRLGQDAPYALSSLVTD